MSIRNKKKKEEEGTPDFEIVHSGDLGMGGDRGDGRVDEETGIHQFFAENLQEMMGGAGGAALQKLYLNLRQIFLLPLR